MYTQEVVICGNWNNVISTWHEKQIYPVKSHYLEGYKPLTRQHLMFCRGGGHGRDPFWSVGRLNTWRENREWIIKDFLIALKTKLSGHFYYIKKVSKTYHRTNTFFISLKTLSSTLPWTDLRFNSKRSVSFFLELKTEKVLPGKSIVALNAGLWKGPVLVNSVQKKKPMLGQSGRMGLLGCWLMFLLKKQNSGRRN